MVRIIFTIFMLAFISNCGGIKIIDRKEVAGLYEQSFVDQVNKIKEEYRRGKVKEALEQLQAIDEGKLKEPEKSLRRNLIGVIFFSKENFEQAIYNFNLALTNSGQDYFLTGQIKLNLASSYFKLVQHEKSIEILKEIPDDSLSPAEAQKAHKLAIKLADETANSYLGALASSKMIQNIQNLAAIKSDSFFEKFLGHFNKLAVNEKKPLIEQMQKVNPMLASYVAYLEAERNYFIGDKNEASRLLDFAKGQSGESQEINDLVANFQSRMENYAKVKTNLIGVVLPLSGKNSDFGRRALMGIDTALKEINSKKSKKNGEKSGEEFQIIIKDSQGIGSLGASQVSELVEDHNVVAIIGGLIPKEAEKEYAEAKNHGTVFFSLSSIFIPREHKDYLLVEIPGSIEGQMETLFSEGFLSNIGKRGGIVYPKSEMGFAYLNEFWRKAESSGVEINSATSYKPNETDFRSIVQLMLGLKYPRMREEENDLLTSIQSMEKSNMRRVQTLPPEVDVDWIFVPAFPKEALQIVPTFSYYDAFNIKFVGGPSWRSGQMSKEASKNHKIVFIGDTVNEVSEEFTKRFFKQHQSNPKLIELRCYDGIKLLADVLDKQNFGSRDEFDNYWRARGKLAGLTGTWTLQSGLWLKEMASLSFERGEVVEINDRKKN